MSRAKQKVSRASLEGTLASLQVTGAREKVSLATLWGSREGDGAAMKPDFAGFMAVEQSRIMRCGCRERVLERTAPLREALPAWRPPPPEACGRNACPGLRLQSGGWPPHWRLGHGIHCSCCCVSLGAELNDRIIDLFLQEIDGQTDRGETVQ